MTRKWHGSIVFMRNLMHKFNHSSCMKLVSLIPPAPFPFLCHIVPCTHECMQSCHLRFLLRFISSLSSSLPFALSFLHSITTYRLNRCDLHKRYMHMCECALAQPHCGCIETEEQFTNEIIYKKTHTHAHVATNYYYLLQFLSIYHDV